MPLDDIDAQRLQAQAAPSAEKQAPLPPPPHVVDLEHPWLGLDSFREETRHYFFGRDAEVAAIHLRLRSHPLLVLYGRSGLGKTSVLNAGLIPRLRTEGQRPVLMRLRYEIGMIERFARFFTRPSDPAEPFGSAFGPCSQLAMGLFQGETKPNLFQWLGGSFSTITWWSNVAEKLAVALPDDPPSHLWLRLHYRDDPPKATHLILDQFEEVFTLGARRPGAENEVRDALAILLQGAIPEPISRLIAEHNTFVDHFDPDSTPVRVILALRDDYVYALNRWKRHIPALGQNNFELRALRGPAAFDVVFNPGELRCHYRGEVSEENKADTGLPPIISEETARRIVRFVAKKGEEVPLEDIEAVPPILSLLCRELNERRFMEPFGTPDRPAGQITFREGESGIETIIATFYERCLAGRPQAVRIFIEEELISYSGARLQQGEKDILKVFEEGCEVPGAVDGRDASGYGDAAAARACLEQLVNQRLLTSLGGENPTYELTHDLLAAVAERRRTAREQFLEAERANLRAEAEKKAKEDAEASARDAAQRAALLTAALQKETEARRDADRATRRARWLTRAAFLVALIAGVAFIAALVARTQTERQRATAVAAREDARLAKEAADELINFMQYDISEAVTKIGHLDVVSNINLRVRNYYEEHPSEPGDLGAIRGKAVSLLQYGDVLLAKGALNDASEQHHAALKMFRELFKQDPENTDYQRDLFITYERIGNVQRDQGDAVGALKSYRDSLGIAEKLAKQDATNAMRQSDLSKGYISVGDALSTQGDRAGALKSYQNSLAVTEKLVKQDPSNPDWQRELSVIYISIGDVQRDQGDLAGALKNSRDSLGIAEKLANQHPSNADWQHGLAASYERLGNVQRDQGDLAGALKSYRDCQFVMEKLVEKDPSNADRQRGLSTAYERVGDVLRDQGDLAGALKSFRDCLAITEMLTKQNSNNIGWQWDLSDFYGDVGKVLRDQADLVGALKSYRDSAAIREKLSKQDPNNAGWQGGLGWIYWQTGAVRAKVEPESKNDARAMVEKGRDILRQLKERTGLTAEQQKWLDAIDAELRGMGGGK